jgi:hypothetical protein
MALRPSKIRIEFGMVVSVDPKSYGGIYRCMLRDEYEDNDDEISESDFRDFKTVVRWFRENRPFRSRYRDGLSEKERYWKYPEYRKRILDWQRQYQKNRYASNPPYWAAARSERAWLSYYLAKACGD